MVVVMVMVVSVVVAGVVRVRVAGAESVIKASGNSCWCLGSSGAQRTLTRQFGC